LTADRDLRRAVAELMVDVHLIPIELANYYAAQMDDFELVRRFQMYTGMELSVGSAFQEESQNG
jgi:hypothetical protein